MKHSFGMLRIFVQATEVPHSWNLSKLIARIFRHTTSALFLTPLIWLHAFFVYLAVGRRMV